METGWIILGAAVVVLLLAVLLLSRRRSADPLPTVTETAASPHPAEPVAAPVVQAPIIDPVPPAIVPEVEVKVASAPAPVTPPPAPVEGADDLSRLKGVGPKLLALLHAEGITRFAQIAAWTDADIAAIDAKLGNFKGRPVRDNWVDQARFLAAGDVAGYEAKYGKL